jgi:hypothetical protein
LRSLFDLFDWEFHLHARAFGAHHFPIYGESELLAEIKDKSSIYSIGIKPYREKPDINANNQPETVWERLEPGRPAGRSASRSKERIVEELA